MKRLLYFILMLTLLVSASACTGKDEGGDDSTASTVVSDDVSELISDIVNSDEDEDDTSVPSESIDDSMTVVPDISGMDPETAEATLKAAGLEVKVREKNYDDVPEGEVAGIDLTVGDTVEKGQKVFLYVSCGKTLQGKALDYKQSALVESREELDVGANSDYEPINYEYVKAVWLSQYDMEDVYMSGGLQREEEEFRAKVKMLFEALKEIGFNTLFVQLRPNGDSFYPSAYYCPSNYVTGSFAIDFTYDPLTIMVEEAHAQSLSIHGWINPLRCMTSSKLEIINVSYGLRAFEQDGKLGDYMFEYDGKMYLNPGREEVRQLIINGATEIVRYYDVDGIHMDDYFYPSGLGVSYDQASFRDQTQYLTTSDFRKGSLNALVSGLYSAVKAENPKVLFGISPAGNIPNVLAASADVYTWLSTTGYVDYIMPQIYWGMQNGKYAFNKIYDAWSNLVTENSIRLIPGMTLSHATAQEDGEWIISKEVLKTCLEYANGKGNCYGFSLFSVDSIIGSSDAARVPSTQEEIDNLFKLAGTFEDVVLE